MTHLPVAPTLERQGGGSNSVRAWLRRWGYQPLSDKFCIFSGVILLLMLCALLMLSCCAELLL